MGKPAEFFAVTFGGSRALVGGKAYSSWVCARYVVHKSTASLRAMWIKIRIRCAMSGRTSDCARRAPANRAAAARGVRGSACDRRGAVMAAKPSVQGDRRAREYVSTGFSTGVNKAFEHRHESAQTPAAIGFEPIVAHPRLRVPCTACPPRAEGATGRPKPSLDRGRIGKSRARPALARRPARCCRKTSARTPMTISTFHALPPRRRHSLSL